MSSILITGANRGIGLEFTKEYLDAGWHVFACCRSPEKADALQTLQQQFRNTLTLIPLDVTNAQQIADLPNHISHASLDILINNAGVFLEKKPNGGFMKTAELTQSILLDTFLINSVAPTLVTQVLLPALLHGEKKIIVNISSTLGSISANKEGGMVAYRASKAALNAITRNFALELKLRQMIVVSIHPGWVQTDMGGKGAEIPTTESVSKMRAFIEKLTPADSGQFFNFMGQKLEW